MYGIAAAVLLQVKSVSKLKFLLIATFAPLFIEYFTGLGLYLGYRLKYWDYSTLFFQYQGIICLQYTIFWILLAYGLVLFFHPISARFYEKQKEILRPGIVCAVLLFSIDIIATFWFRAGGILL